MRHWMMDLRYGCKQPAQTTLIDKFGGKPWGIPEHEWPICQECGNPMQFLAQIQHQPPMIDLGHPDTVMTAFMCNLSSVCSFWDADHGSNSVRLDAVSALQGTLSDYPLHLAKPDEIKDQPTEFLELRLQGWVPFDDPLTQDHKAAFYSVLDHLDLPFEIAYPYDPDAKYEQKAGPIPYWTGNGPPRRLAKADVFMQILGDRMLVNDSPPTDQDLRSAPNSAMTWDNKIRWPMTTEQNQDGLSACEWANFCSDGTGFFFHEETAKGRVFGLEISR